MSGGRSGDGGGGGYGEAIGGSGSGAGVVGMSDATLPRGAKGEAPRYFDDPEVGKVLAIVMALTGEVSVMRDRLDTIERLMEAGVPVTRRAIEDYLPDTAVRLERDAWRQQYLAMVLRVLHEERDALAQAAAQR